MLRILHVDDEAGIRSIAKLALESIGGFSISSCGSGEEALASIAAEIPDLIVLDVMMPGMDGPATYIAIQKNPAAAGIPVIFMTGNTQKDEVDMLMELGAIGVIAKPFDPVQLSAEIQRIWDSRTTG